MHCIKPILAKAATICGSTGRKERCSEGRKGGREGPHGRGGDKGLWVNTEREGAPRTREGRGSEAMAGSKGARREPAPEVTGKRVLGQQREAPPGRSWERGFG